jgi:hypothetical protein
VPGLLRRVVGRVLRDFWAAQVQMGMALGGGGQQPLAGPPPGHPEQLAHDTVLDAEERMLWADILGQSPGG